MLPKQSKRMQRIAGEFIQSNGLKTLQVCLANQVKTQMYPLKTVMALWRHFDSISELPEVKKNLLWAFLAKIPYTEETQHVIQEERVSGLSATPIPAKQVRVELSQKLHLQVLVYQGSITSQR